MSKIPKKPQAYPPAEMTLERLERIHWLAAVAPDGSVAAIELREAVTEIYRLRSEVQRLKAQKDCSDTKS